MQSLNLQIDFYIVKLFLKTILDLYTVVPSTVERTNGIKNPFSNSGVFFLRIFAYGIYVYVYQ